MCQLERRIAVADFNPRVRQLIVCLIILAFSAPPRGIEHDPHLHAAMFCRNDGVGKTGIGKKKHPDLNRSFGSRQGIKNWLRGILGKHDQGMRHGASKRIVECYCPAASEAARSYWTRCNSA